MRGYCSLILTVLFAKQLGPYTSSGWSHWCEIYVKDFEIKSPHYQVVFFVSIIDSLQEYCWPYKASPHEKRVVFEGSMGRDTLVAHGLHQGAPLCRYVDCG